MLGVLSRNITSLGEFPPFALSKVLPKVSPTVTNRTGNPRRGVSATHPTRAMQLSSLS